MIGRVTADVLASSPNDLEEMLALPSLSAVYEAISKRPATR